ncbi:hypothetical protein EVAR_48229_1 [Eumeta japonica]|uniref:Uncharacterized protein n=1 Tax=Eumeta variegata TaxID=151549 RepID=A0A4C1YGK4_EUMVA|nr:hypothetical protein EVAR_48229_1 [Eumeta japonica]
MITAKQEGPLRRPEHPRALNEVVIESAAARAPAGGRRVAAPNSRERWLAVSPDLNSTWRGRRGGARARSPPAPPAPPAAAAAGAGRGSATSSRRVDDFRERRLNKLQSLIRTKNEGIRFDLSDSSANSVVLFKISLGLWCRQPRADGSCIMHAAAFSDRECALFCRAAELLLHSASRGSEGAVEQTTTRYAAQASTRVVIARHANPNGVRVTRYPLIIATARAPAAA